MDELNIIKIPNISDYIFEIIDNTLILTYKTQLITEDELYKHSLSYSSILECIINDEHLEKTKIKYIDILIHIYKSMPINIILQNTTFNFKFDKIFGDKGYHWHDDINMSIQNKDANSTIKEIINMIKINNYTFYIKIKLSSEKIICFKI